MKQKSIIIIGAGLGGLSAGIYGQLNGYSTHVFELHTQPGGQCTAWTRKGYTFDACIHHLFGCSPASHIYQIWREIGAAPREFLPLDDCVSVLSPDGTLFRDYYDLERLETHMNAVAPGDSRMIRDYINGIRATARSDAMGRMMVGSRLDVLASLPSAMRSWRWTKLTMSQFGQRFTDPFMRRAVPLLIYSNPTLPLQVHLVRHAYGLNGALQWPRGGALEFARSIEQKYREMGGTVHYRSRVVNILTHDGKATGVRLEDGSEHHADIVLSNADGRKTTMELLDGRFVDQKVKAECMPMGDEVLFGVQVFLGIARDLSREPTSMIMLMDKPVTLASRTCHELEMQLYGFDPSMAPEGKSVIKVEFPSHYSYWKALAGDRRRYEEAKQQVASQVIDILESRYFAGLRRQVEVVDVATLLTWERFTGGTMGLGIYPTRKMSVFGSVFGKPEPTMLPGLRDLYFTGTWDSCAGALFLNALSGKHVIQAICMLDGRRFTAE